MIMKVMIIKFRYYFFNRTQSVREGTFVVRAGVGAAFHLFLSVLPPGITIIQTVNMLGAFYFYFSFSALHSLFYGK